MSSLKSNIATGIASWLAAIIAVLALLLLLLTVFGGPLALNVATRFLQQHDAIVAEGATVAINPFSSVISIENLRVVEDDATVLNIGRLRLHLSLSALLQQQVVITQAELDDLVLFTRQLENAIETAGVTLATSSDHEETDSHMADDDQKNRWRVRLPTLAVNRSTLITQHPDYTNHTVLEQFTVRDFELSAGSLQGQLTWLGRVDQSPVDLSLQFNVTDPLDQQLKANVTGRYHIADLNIADYLSLLPESLKPLRGDVALAGKLQLTHDQQNTSLELEDTRLKMKQGQWNSPAATVSLATSQLDLGPLTLSTSTGLRDRPDVAANNTPSWQLSASPTLVADELELTLPDSGQQISLQQLSLKVDDVKLEQQDDLAVSVRQSSGHVRGLLVDLNGYHIDSRQQSVELAKLTINGLLSNQPQAAFDSAIHIGPTTIADDSTVVIAAWDQLALKPNTLAIKHSGASPEIGEAATLQLPGGTIRLQQGRLTLPDVALSLADSQLDVGDLELAWASGAVKDNDTEPATRLNLQFAPTLELDRVNLTLPAADQRVTLERLNVSLTDTALQWAQDLSLSAGQGKSDSKGLSIGIEGYQIDSRSQSLELAELSLTGLMRAQPSISLHATSEIGVTSVVNEELGVMVAAWDQLGLASGQLDIDASISAALANINIENLKTLVLDAQPGDQQSSTPLFRADGLQLADLKLQDRHLSIDKVSLKQLEASTSSTSVAEIKALFTTAGSENATTEPENQQQSDQGAPAKVDEGEPFTYSVNQVDIAKGSWLRFTDRSMASPVTNTIFVEQYQLGALDSRQPEQQTAVNFKGSDGQYAKYQLVGSIQPLMSQLNLSLQGAVHELPLYPLSPYIKSAVGYDIVSGQLDTDFELSIVNNYVKGEARTHLRAMELDEPEEGKAIQGGAITLNLAVEMLKDGNGNIELSVPFDGPVEKLQVGISGFVTLIVKKALMQTTQEYLLQALTPYASVVKVVMLAGNQALKLRFQPLLYTPGETALEQTQTEYITQFVAVMKDNEYQQVGLCAMSTLSDVGITDRNELTVEQRSALKAIGLRRAQLLKAKLVAEGIASSRLLGCAQRIDESADARPRIEFES